MPSSEHGLDSRRLKDVKPRNLSGEDYSLDNLPYRMLVRRLTEVVGPEATAEYFKNRGSFLKHWNACPVGSVPGESWK